MGDIAHIRKKGKILARTAYYSGWRPSIRKSLRAACPEMAALIKEMWQTDFRARPAMSDVVVRLEACVSVGDVAIDDPEEGSEASSPFAENKDESAKQVHALQARVKALAYLHHELAEPLIHRDVKPDNILVGDGVVAKLADFGESRRFDKKEARRNSLEGEDALSMTMVGTKLYCAPEVMMMERYNESAVSLFILASAQLRELV